MKDDKKLILYLILHNKSWTAAVSCGPVSPYERRQNVHSLPHFSLRSLRHEQLVYPVHLSVLMKDVQIAHSIPHTLLRGQRLRTAVFPVDLSFFTKDDRKANYFHNSSRRGQRPWTAGASCCPFSPYERGPKSIFSTSLIAKTTTPSNSWCFRLMCQSLWKTTEKFILYLTLR